MELHAEQFIRKISGTVKHLASFSQHHARMFPVEVQNNGFNLRKTVRQKTDELLCSGEFL